MMTRVAAGVALNLLALTSIGIGPSLWMTSGPQRHAVALAIAPITGFALLTVAGTVLVVADLPVSAWSSAFATIGSAAGSTLAILALRRWPLPRPVPGWQLVAPLGVFVVAGALLLWPFVAGGPPFAILRGNGTDSFNYTAVAGYLDHTPYHWALQQDAATLLERHPSYPLVRKLLDERWATAMSLAVTARLAGTAPLLFEYGMSTLVLLLTFGPLFVWARLLGATVVQAMLAGVAVCAGSWAQFLIDLRADSQQNALPLLLALGLGTARIESGGAAGRGEYLLLGLLGGALLLQYPEMLPIAGLGLALSFALGLRRRTRPDLAGYALSLLIAAVIVLPVLPMLARFFQVQVESATRRPNDWHLAYFDWLYASPLAGLWWLNNQLPSPAPARAWLTLLLGAALTAIAAVAAVRAWRTASAPASTIAAGMAAACVLGAAWLVYRAQWWAAGKVLVNGYPFLVLLLVAAAAQTPSPPATPARGGPRGWWRAPVSAAVLLFFMVQGVCAATRPWRATESPASVGIVGHAEYRRHDWDVAAITRALAAHPGGAVWSAVGNPWLAEYLALTLGWQVPLRHLDASRARLEYGLSAPDTDRPPEFVIVDKARLVASTAVAIAAETSELLLLETTGASRIVMMDNPNGVEGTVRDRFVWLGNETAAVQVIAAGRGCASFTAMASIGPSHPTRPLQVLMIGRGGESPARRVVAAGPLAVPIRLDRALTQLRLRVDDTPTVRLDTDSRPLLLRLDRPRIDAVPCEIVARGAATRD